MLANNMLYILIRNIFLYKLRENTHMYIGVCILCVGMCEFVCMQWRLRYNRIQLDLYLLLPVQTTLNIHSSLSLDKFKAYSLACLTTLRE